MYKEKFLNPEFQVQLKYPWRKTEMKTFLEQKKKKENCCQQRCTIRNVKGSSSDRKEMIPDKKLDIQERIKSIINGK